MEIPGIQLNPLAPPAYLVAGAVLFALLCAWLSWRSGARMPPVWRAGAAFCRALGAACLFIPLLNPGHWESERIAEEAVTVVLVDTSASMRVGDADGERRADAALEAAEQTVQAAAGAGRSVRLMTFDATARVADEEALRAADFSGDGSDLALALNRTADLFGTAGGRLSEVVLIGDGRDTGRDDPGQAVRRLVGLDAKLHTIPYGGAVRPVDARVTAPRRQVTAFTGREVIVRADVFYEGGGRVRSRVAAAGMGNAAEEVVDLESGEKREVRFVLPPMEAGLHEMEFVLDAVPGEEDLSNNGAPFAVLVHDEPIRVLLIEGSPYWDTKFIAQLLQQDPNYRFELIYRLSDDRFFGLDDEAPEGAEGAEGVAEARERRVFPATPEELAGIDLVLFGRNTDEFLTESNVANLREWVAAGGAVVFARGNPVSADWPALEALAPMDWDVDWRGEFRWQPTPLADDSGLFGDGLPGSEDPVWKRLPLFQQANFGMRLRPFSQVLVEGVASGSERERRFPLVASRRFGAGLVTTVNVSDFWRWDFIPDSEEAREIYRAFWSRLFEWSLAYSEFLPGENFALRLGASETDPERPVRVRVLRRAGTEENAEPLLMVRHDDGLTETAAVSPVEGEPDLWETLVRFPSPGVKRLNVVLADARDESRAIALLTVRSPPSESDDLSADPELMAALAAAAGGVSGGMDVIQKCFLPDAAESGREGDMHWRPAWTNPWLALAIVSCLAVEWFLRRRHNLA